MHCFVVAPDPRAAKIVLLIQHVQTLGLPVDIVTGLDTLLVQRRFVDAKKPIVLVADLTSSESEAERAYELAVTQAERAYVIYVSDTIQSYLYKRLVRTKAADWSNWDLLPSELSDIIKRRAEEVIPVSNAQIISFFPTKGGVGNTTLASEVAVSLAASRSHPDTRLALLDLNLDGGTLADALDLDPRFDILEVTSHPERLDSQLIDVFASRYSDRLDVFAPFARWVTLAEIAPQSIFAVLDLLANRYSVILIDMPKQRLLWTDNLLQGSDLVIVSGSSTVPALKQLRSKLGQLDDLNIEKAKLAVVVNQCERSFLGKIVRRKEIEKALPGRQIFFVRDDAATVRTAANAGRPIVEVSSGSRISSDIRKFVRWVTAAIDFSPIYSAKS